MFIQLLGAGSLGMLFAGKLRSASCQVQLITHRQEQFERLRLEGLTVIENEMTHSENISLRLLSKNTQLEPIPESYPDWIFLMVKQKDINDELLLTLQLLMGNTTKLLCFQNGMGHVAKLTEQIPHDKIYLAVTTEGARKQTSSVVQHTGSGMTWIGKASESVEQESSFGSEEKKLLDCIRQAGFDASLSNRMNSVVWSKLLINAIINPLTAIHRIPNGDLLTSPPLQQLMRCLLEEGEMLAERMGIQLPESLWEQLLTVCERTANNQSSMLQDILTGHRTEIDWISGSLLALSSKYGLALPTHRTLYLQVKSLEKPRNG